MLNNRHMSKIDTLAVLTMLVVISLIFQGIVVYELIGIADKGEKSYNAACSTHIFLVHRQKSDLQLLKVTPKGPFRDSLLQITRDRQSVLYAERNLKCN